MPPAGRRSVEIEIESLERELALLENDLREADPRYAELRYPRPCTLDEIRRHLSDERELLLEYVLADSASYLWALTRDDGYAECGASAEVFLHHSCPVTVFLTTGFIDGAN